MAKSFHGPTSLFPDIFVLLSSCTFHFIRLCLVSETFSFPALRTWTECKRNGELWRHIAWLECRRGTLCISEIPGLVIGPENIYLGWAFCSFSHPLQRNAWIVPQIMQPRLPSGSLPIHSSYHLNCSLRLTASLTCS